MKDRFRFKQGGSEGTRRKLYVLLCCLFFCWKIGEEWDGAVLMGEVSAGSEG